MILNVVATPIGNLSDISLRAKETLERATLIIAEDTRTTKKLLSLLGSPTSKLADKKFISSHAQSSQKELERALATCLGHEDIALVTDAGTPAISDPGSYFINAFRLKYPDAQVVPIPGASAVIAALSVSGFSTSHFEFLGFIPHKKGRQTILKKILDTEHTVVFYESPHRIMKTLGTLAELLGTRRIMIGREMTKQFEEYPIGTAKEIFDYYSKNEDKVRGEFVVVVSTTKGKHDIMSE